MSKTSSDPSKYYRAGVAIPMASKPILMDRLNALGMKTIGELATFFIQGFGVVEALEPLVKEYRAQRPAVTARSTKKQVLNLIKDMTPEQVQALIALAAAAQQPKQG